MDALYIHIPFCKQICFYCDFPKKIGKDKEIDAYLDALYKELTMHELNKEFNTVYIGGGTPSLLSLRQLEKLNKIIKLIPLAKEYEFTIECNPEQITLEKIQYYKKIGINRISLGVQTFNDKLLKLLNRSHKKDDIFQAIEIMKNNGFHNISIDLMFGLPFQTFADVKEDLRLFKALNIPHLSYYSLILEDKTVFSNMLDKGLITLVDNELEAKMYDYIIKEMKNMGYIHYEISNFAKTGFESKHNLKYWLNKDYLAIGMGASSNYHNTRYYNVNHVNHYIALINENKLPIKDKDNIDNNEKIKETILIGLRLIEGINITDINQRFKINILELFSEEIAYLQRKGLIEIDSHIKLTYNGLFYGNEVFQMFI